MSNEILVENCAPTLAGLKTGNLFSCPCPDRRQLMREVRDFNRAMRSRGLLLVPLRYSERRVLLYLYRPAALRRDLSTRRARAILDRAGYAGLEGAQCVSRLKRRLGESGDFPHEIGLFLGYPPEDVLGFMENHAQNSKFTGYWKVYGDEAAARRTFAQYKTCTDAYCRSLRAGARLDQLAVSEHL